MLDLTLVGPGQTVYKRDQARITALEDGLKASAARLDATRLGRTVGDRTLMDVLNAENDQARATLALAEARAAQLQNRLRLAALADRLDEGTLREVNAALQETPLEPATAPPPASAPGPSVSRPARAVRGDRR